MGWTSTAPKLPNGSYPSYTSAGSVGRSSDVYNCTIEFAYARLDKNNISIRFKLTAGAGRTSYVYPGYVNFQVGNGTAQKYGWANSLTRWWTGNLDEGTYVTVKAGASNSATAYDHATYGEKTIKGPAYTEPIYTVAYYSNNGAGLTATQSKTWGYGVNLYSCGWTKEGHTFDHWDTAADGSGADYTAGQNYTTNANLTLYAIWAPNTFAVTYDANGGTGTTESQSKTYGTDLTLRANGFTAPTGHHFVEWNTAADGSGTPYEAEGTYTANAAATLYAIWSPDTYAVTFDGNGADGGSQAPETKTYGTRLVVPGCTFTRSGYTFSAWNTASDGSGTSYAAGSYYETNAAVTLYAIWTKNNIPVYVNDDGTIRQVVKAYMNIGGTVYEGTLYMNVGGTIYEIG